MDDTTLTISEFCEIVRGGLEQLFPSGVWVEGEISGLTRARTGHVYFDLIESADQVGRTPVATVPVVLFRDARDRVNRLLKKHGDPIRMDDGVKIRIQGMVDLYPPSGKLQLRMTAIDPTYTLGRLAAERDALLARLAAEDLLRRNAALPLPAVPLRVGLITSVGSAAHADVMTVLARSELAFTVVEVDTAVQGSGAEHTIAAALNTVMQAAVDLVILARGGGSRTDLATFDHEIIARTIATAPVPVFTGLGHDIDRSVADEVSHTSHLTPTAAAQSVVDLVLSWLGRLDDLSGLVLTRAHGGLRDSHQRVDRLATAVVRSGRGGIERGARRVEDSVGRLIGSGRRVDERAGSQLRHAITRLTGAGRSGIRAAEIRLGARRDSVLRRAPRVLSASDRELEGVAARVRALDPALALARGWSITRRDDGRVVRSRIDVEVGDVITTQVADGTLTSTIRNAPDEGHDG